MGRKSKKANQATIKIIGVGGGGSNAVSRMKKDKVQGVDLICMNTDAQALARMDVPVRLQIGEKLTKGLGVGGDPKIGWKSAEESHEEIEELVGEADMVFIAAGMGGGTGTGAAPVVASIAKKAGALTVGVVTRPFSFEGQRRRLLAEEGIQLLAEQVDTLVIINNDQLLELCDIQASVMDAFTMVDDVLSQGIQAISDIINVAGEINVDFADVKSIMSDSGRAMMAIGLGEGEDRASKAINAVLSSPLLDTSIQGAMGILFNISGGDDLTLLETNRVADLVGKAANPDAEMMFGVVHDSKLNGQMRITLIATGLDADEPAQVVSREKRRIAVPNGKQAGVRPESRDKGGTRFPRLFRKHRVKAKAFS